MGVVTTRYTASISATPMGSASDVDRTLTATSSLHTVKHPAPRASLAPYFSVPGDR